MDQARAKKNLDLYIELFATVTVEKNFLKMTRPEISSFNEFLSYTTLPTLMIAIAGTQTVLEVLTDTWEEEMVTTVEEMKLLFVANAALFVDKQLSLAYERVVRLRQHIEEGCIEDV